MSDLFYVLSVYVGAPCRPLSIIWSGVEGWVSPPNPPFVLHKQFPLGPDGRVTVERDEVCVVLLSHDSKVLGGTMGLRYTESVSGTGEIRSHWGRCEGVSPKPDLLKFPRTHYSFRKFDGPSHCHGVSFLPP